MERWIILVKQKRGIEGEKTVEKHRERRKGRRRERIAELEETDRTRKC